MQACLCVAYSLAVKCRALMNQLTELHNSTLCPKSVLLIYVIGYKTHVPAVLRC